MTSLGWVLLWVVLVAAAIIVPIVLLWKAWGKLKGVGREMSVASDQLAAASSKVEAHPLAPLRAPGPGSDADARDAAYAQRADVAVRRAQRRQARVDAAHDRWLKAGIIDETAPQ
ncbi:MAG: hypothetical protein E7A62_00730 [Actinomycetaceae bacterium]|nr:hypothetical protein [Actinomycetaceae bacterium]MDU0969503.1 hypothetical protein [Actinomycetaceae bacterium]